MRPRAVARGRLVAAMLEKAMPALLQCGRARKVGRASRTVAAGHSNFNEAARGRARKVRTDRGTNTTSLAYFNEAARGRARKGVHVETCVCAVVNTSMRPRAVARGRPYA